MWTRACVPRRLDDFSGPQPALFSFALPEAPTFVLADLTYTSCSPSAILFLPGRAVHGRKHGRMPPHMGQTMADTRGPCPLFARSCFDEVGPRPHNAVTFFSVPFFLSFFLFFALSLCWPPFRCLVTTYHLFRLLNFEASSTIFKCPIFKESN